MVGRTAPVALLAVAAFVAGCAAPAETSPSGEPTTGTRSSPATTFGRPPSSDVLLRALRTDLCALLDEAVLAELGWQRGTAQAQTFTSCAAGSADQQRSVRLSMDTAVADRAGPADGDRCTAVRIVDQATMIAIKVLVRTEPDPCGPAERFLATAVERFDAGAGAVEPPDPWIALDACELLAPLLDTSADTLGGPSPTLREVRRLGPRGCIANHERGEVTLSVSPAPGRAADLDGDEVAVGVRPGRLREFGDTCVVRLVGRQLGVEGMHAPQTQVLTVEVASEQVAAPQRCAAATAMAETLAAGV